MKNIKLILVFVIVCVAVIAAFLLIPDNGHGLVMAVESNEYQLYRDEIIDDWRKMGDWNDSLYKRKADKFKQVGESSLIDLNTKTASEIVYKKIFEEWKSATCRKYAVKRYINAVSVIEKVDANALFDPNMQQIKKVNEVYKRVYKLSHQNIGFTPRFDGSEWIPFDKYSTSVLKDKEDILDNNLYKSYLSNISEISNGLNSIPEKLNRAKSQFYDSLADQIIEEFSRIPSVNRKEEDLKRLRNVISQYEREYASNRKLTDFTKKFNDDVKNK